MKTLLFCTSYIANASSWESRYRRWLQHHRQCGAQLAAITFVDDGSPFLPTDLPVIPAATMGQVDLPAESIIHFSEHLAGATKIDIPGWWRGLFAALALARHYGFHRLIHVPSDSFIVSERFASYLADTTSGWTTLQLGDRKATESVMQVICEDAFERLEAMVEKGPYGFAGQAAQHFLREMRVEHGFNGAHDHEVEQSILAGADSIESDLIGAVSTFPKHSPAAAPPVHPLELPRADTALTEAFESESTNSEFLQRAAGLHEAFPYDAETACRYGIGLYLSGDFVKARRVLERADWIRPEHGLTCKFLAAARMQQQELAGAIAAALQSARLRPEDSAALNMTGAFLLQSGKSIEAVRFFELALEQNPEDSSALSNLASVDWKDPATAMALPGGFHKIRMRVRAALIEKLRLNRLSANGAATLLGFGVHFPDDFADLLLLAKAVVQDPASDAQTLFFCGNAFGVAGEVANSLDAYSRAAQLAPESERLRGAIGYTLICQGESAFLEGFRMANDSWPQINPSAFISAPARWKGVTQPCRKLLVYQEQGIGDALLCLRLLPLLQTRSVDAVLWLRPELAELVLDQAGVPLVKHPERPGCDEVGADCATSLFGLIDAMEVDTVPPPLMIKAPALDVERFRKMLASKTQLRVGVNLFGNPDRSDDWTRSLSAPEFDVLATLDGVDWVNLSVDERPEQRQLKETLPDMLDFRSELVNFKDTAALISNLDLVIAIDSVIAHLAAALGKAVFLLAPTTADWRWKIGNSMSPWWPDIEMFEAHAPGQFGLALEAVAVRVIEIRDRFSAT